MAAQKILVIDDSKVIRMRVKDMLPAGSFEVLEAKDGAQGWNMICNDHPTLIMLDFLLPKMSGWEVYQEIQKNPHVQHIPLVLMSGRKEEVTEKIPEPFEYFSFVGKPFEQKELIKAIKDAMAMARKRPKVAAPKTAETETPKGANTSALEAEVATLKKTVAKMQGEINGLKKQMTQLATIIKQKLK